MDFKPIYSHSPEIAQFHLRISRLGFIAFFQKIYNWQKLNNFGRNVRLIKMSDFMVGK